MQKSLTPKQKLEYETLGLAIEHAERAIHEAELAAGRNSPQYVIAERERDEIVAKMQRITHALDNAESGAKPAAGRVTTLVVSSKRAIKRKASKG